DISPGISGNNVVWSQSDGNDSEIFLYNGNETVQLTDNDVDDVFSFSRISGNNVVWSRSDGNDSEIFFYNGSETIQLTNNDVDDASPRISGDNVVWTNGSGSGEELFLYNGSEIIQLTDDNLQDFAPRLLGDNVFWLQFNNFESGEPAKVLLATPNDVDFSSGTVYRFLNNDTGVHFYTASENELDAVQELDNYTFEGASYQSVNPLTGADNSVPVYRFLNNDTGVHLYTINETEREAVEGLDDFSFEGEVFSAYASEIEGSIPIYRFFNSNTGAHFYTPSAVERDNIEASLPDYESEGIAYYALPVESEVI
ncbi:MAG: hypothetical protein AAFN00_22520, partial [Cyanobacteria bacterium J06558_2]